MDNLNIGVVLCWRKGHTLHEINKMGWDFQLMTSVQVTLHSVIFSNLLWTGLKLIVHLCRILPTVLMMRQ